MLLDALTNFLPLGSNLAVTNAAVRSNIYDILGSGVGTAPQNIIGTRTLFGQDDGIGSRKPLVQVNLTNLNWAGGTSLNVAFQAAVDTGAAGNYQPGAWLTLVETGAIALANLTAQQVLAKFDFPPAFPPGVLPRYLSLLFTPVGVFTAGAIGSAIVTMDRDDQTNKYAAKNFTVA